MNGGVFKFIIVTSVLTLAFIASKVVSSILIQQWCNDPTEDDQYVLWYLGICLIGIAFLYILNYSNTISFARQSITVHKQMIKSLLYASLGDFFNRVPTGRIVSRLTKDLR